MLLFAIGYGGANRFQLTHGVADLVAAGDGHSAIVAFLSLAFQAAVFMAALFLFPRRWTMGLVQRVSTSAVSAGGALPRSAW